MDANKCRDTCNSSEISNREAITAGTLFPYGMTAAAMSRAAGLLELVEKSATVEKPATCSREHRMLDARYTRNSKEANSSFPCQNGARFLEKTINKGKNCPFLSNNDSCPCEQ
jgi:hypothetical protein